jgi:hypothetical protein
MSQTNDNFNPFDPTGMLKGIRDANLDAVSKMMIECVSSDAYARATGTVLDGWLAGSTPFRKAVEAALTQALAGLNMPSRGEVASLAERLTNVEMRLDDIEAKLDECLRAVAPRSRAGAKNKAANGESQT